MINYQHHHHRYHYLSSFPFPPPSHYHQVTCKELASVIRSVGLNPAECELKEITADVNNGAFVGWGGGV